MHERWLPFIHRPHQRWAIHRRPNNDINTTYRSVHQAVETLRSSAPSFTWLPAGVIHTEPVSAVRVMVGPAVPRLVAPPDRDGRLCAPGCPLHPDVPMAHILGHDTLGVRTARLLARHGYHHPADLELGVQTGSLKLLSGFGPASLGRVSRACAPLPLNQHDLGLDTPRLASLLGQAAALIPLTPDPRYDALRATLQRARAQLNDIKDHP